MTKTERQRGYNGWGFIVLKINNYRWVGRLFKVELVTSNHCLFTSLSLVTIMKIFLQSINVSIICHYHLISGGAVFFLAWNSHFCVITVTFHNFFHHFDK